MKSFAVAASALIAIVGAAALFAAPPGVSAPGAVVFAQNCAACHQASGKGIPGAFPALAGDKFVVGNPAGPIAVVLNGRGGMPTFRDDLNDAQIAAALSHVRNSWGNKAPPITPAMVAKLRTTKMTPNKLNPLGAH